MKPESRLSEKNWVNEPGWLVFSKFIKYRGNFAAEFGDLQSNKPWSTSSNRASLDDSSAPGIKTIEEELCKWTGVDGFFAVHHKYSGETL
jgi:hypothetical protein